MSKSVLKPLSDFLESNWDKRRGLLLAFSGGPDSLALLHLLLDYKKEHSLPLALAHVDHGWRAESRDEAQEIAVLAGQMGLPLHVKHLCPDKMYGNLEAACREERLNFFSQICETYNYQAVLIAHHADDFAETVLKRILEGSSLSSLSGLRPVADLYGVQVWRPLLTLKKQSLVDFLSRLQLKGLEDQTNNNLKFLRARMRAEMIPHLSKQFGKEVSSNLCRIGMDALELRDYFDEKIAPFLARVVSSQLGDFLDLSSGCPEALMEVKHLIRRFSERKGVVLSRDCLNLASELLVSNAANKTVSMGDNHLYIDRGCLFLVSGALPSIPDHESEVLQSITHYGSWVITVDRVLKPEPSCTDWKSLWQFGGEVVLPEGDYILGSSLIEASYPRTSSLRKWWTDHKVPSLFRRHVPVLYQNGQMIHEFLTGRKKNHQSIEATQWIKIGLTLQRNKKS